MLLKKPWHTQTFKIKIRYMNGDIDCMLFKIKKPWSCLHVIQFISRLDNKLVKMKIQTNRHQPLHLEG
jgi:hypothetical protein